MPAERTKPDAGPTKGPHPGKAEEKARILLVDDREDKLLALETVIAELDQNIVKASSGKEALRCLLHGDFAVILLDVNMPGMDGFETAHLIRQKQSLEHTPIIFITSIGDTETHFSRGYALGAVDYILTPVLPEVLRTKVAVFVELFKKNAQLKRQTELLQQAHDELELRVRERTAELGVANNSLQAEITERQRVEDEVRKINDELERRVIERTEELAAANQELEAFTYSVAHDLQAPLRNIQSYSELLDDEFGTLLPDEARGYLRRISNRSKYMAQMVADLLKLSRIGKQELNRQETGMNGLVEEVVTGLKQENGKREIEWEIGELSPLACDPRLVKLIFANLLSNAVKYTQPRKPARIEIGQTRIDDEISIYIKDNGVGFNMQNADKLFGVFQRLHPPEAFEGTGIGLATVARIVRKHGGRVWAEAKEDGGATFYFTLGQKAPCRCEPAELQNS
jgi:two-component system, sensor histidine kinase and response regulator